MTKAELSKKTGVSPRAIRFYEEHGFIPEAPRLSNGYRSYEVEFVTILNFFKNGKELGLTLEEIKELIELRIFPGADCQDVYKKVQIKKNLIQKKITNLKNVIKALDKLSCSCALGKTIKECDFVSYLGHTKSE